MLQYAKERVPADYLNEGTLITPLCTVLIVRQCSLIYCTVLIVSELLSVQYSTVAISIQAAIHLALLIHLVLAGVRQ